MADKAPPPIDSRTWSGDLPISSPPPPPASPAQLRAALAELPAVLAILAALTVPPRAAAALWRLTGEPLLIVSGPNALTLGGGVAAALIAVLLAKRQPVMSRVAVGACALSVTAFSVHAYQYLADRRMPSETFATSLFVEQVRMPSAFARRAPLVPTITVSTRRGGRMSMIAPAGFATRLTPKDSCLRAVVRPGRRGFAFVEARITSAGDGTGSFLVATDNRARCLET